MIMKLKNIFILIIALAISAVVNSSQAQSRQTRQEYIAKYSHIAIKHMERYGIPASITMAQGLLESDCGNSELSTKSNNHFGIKCKTGWTGRKVYHDDDAKGECFRAYATVEQSYEDHAVFLDSSPRYDPLFSHSSTDYKSWAKGLKAAGYATAPTYAPMLIKIIEDEKLYLLDRKGGASQYAQSQQVTLASGPVATGSIDPDNYGVTINSHMGYNISRINDLYCTLAKRGDSVSSLSKAFKISRRNLRAFNDLDRKDILKEGDIIYLERKKSRWKGDKRRTHTVVAGENLRLISQKYGIRYSRLARRNDFKTKGDPVIKPGQIIKIR